MFVTNSNPGPGAYDPTDKQRFKSLHYSMRKKTAPTENNQEDVPGPIYKIDSTLLDQNKHLSIYIRRNSTKICQPRNCFSKKLGKTITEPVGSLEDEKVPTRFISSKGRRTIGHNHPNILMSKSRRTSGFLINSNTPGPGQYQSFSEFPENDSLAYWFLLPLCIWQIWKD